MQGNEIALPKLIKPTQFKHFKPNICFQKEIKIKMPNILKISLILLKEIVLIYLLRIKINENNNNSNNNHNLYLIT